MLDLRTQRQLGAIQRQNAAIMRSSAVRYAAGGVTAPRQGGYVGIPPPGEGVSVTHTDGSVKFLFGLMGMTDDVWVE